MKKLSREVRVDSTEVVITLSMLEVVAVNIAFDKAVSCITTLTNEIAPAFDVSPIQNLLAVVEGLVLSGVDIPNVDNVLKSIAAFGSTDYAKAN